MVTPTSTIPDQDLEQLTSLFRLLSDKTRLNILMLLAQGGTQRYSSLPGTGTSATDRKPPPWAFADE